MDLSDYKEFFGNIFAHIDELRARFIRIDVALVLGFITCYYFREDIFAILMYPLTINLPPGNGMVYIHPAEMFITYLKVSALAGFLLASPYVLYQLWAFISSLFPGGGGKQLFQVTAVSMLLFFGGLCFGYFVVFPFGFKFLIENYTTAEIRPMLTMGKNFSLISIMLLAFGAIFEIPIIFFLLAKAGLVSYRALKKFRLYAILGAFIIGAILTPTPDIFNQTLMAVPIIVLYEASIWVTYVVERNKRKAR